MGREQQDDQGFTLIEALIAVLVLVFGLIAVAQLMAVAGSSNAIANRSTVAAATASEELERLMTVPYGDLGTNAGADLDNMAACSAGTFGSLRNVAGTSQIQTCWRIETVAGVPNLLFIRVRSQAEGPFSNLTRAELTSFRAINGAPAAASPSPGATP